MKLTAEIARELLQYEPDTGKLFWKERDRKWFKNDGIWKSWNKRFADKLAFTSGLKNEYKQGAVFNIRYQSHRIIWLLQTGEWPDDEIDHIDHNRADNRWVNLREVTRQENMKNGSRNTNNTSGVVGVCWDKQRHKWLAQVVVDAQCKSLGHFVLFEDAVAARKAAEAKYGFHKNHGMEK